ncbi:WD40 repeat-like protein [Massarina eburnea CBS 473.64]|uniref:WD40 repeat-like protein n=1 Tax=Massarina eburnea CBS 473.64 TaxID=1395130 RepID=A0A6A6S4R9_9PLEO|nr:WD40 repeat-like protein [Massarina eburnea CBS 473.64]
MTGPLGNPSEFAPSYLQAFGPASSMANRFDEGYSEDTRSQSSDLVMRTDLRMGDSAMEQDSQYLLQDWVMQMSESERSDYAYALLRTLRTSSIAAIVDKLNPLLHLDPVAHLPPEITFQIFSYLSPETLLRASTLSRAWRVRIIDSPLWKLLFRLEGWNSNFGVVRTYEEKERLRRAQLKEKERKRRPRVAEDGENDKPSSKKRARERTLFGDGVTERLEPLSLDNATEGSSGWGEQHGEVEAEADDGSPLKADDHMEGIRYENASPLASPTESSRRRKRSSGDESDYSMSALRTGPNSMDPPLRPSLLLPTIEPKVNWQYLYKQKRRLEENWDNGRYTNFQLPHPQHPDEAHTECVYTIQYSGKFLVSGSRDKTIRVWNLDTQRLVLPPLFGHRASVLCLQFDERPEHDLIVTAGSDRNVILWQFSTGRIIKRLDEAHAESVLNLRFDDTYLVTCSKDKSIKVWNRKELLPTDDAYPLSTTKSAATFPSYIIDMKQQVENQHLHFNPLPPHTLIMTLEGHGAAVNAIQILDGQIVSASGDRSVKVWDVRTGACTRTFSGHTKGIACVQFDGRRIVSGSSDETVRIFDRATGAEIACLQGHSNLVRTVQAQFGDLPGNEEELEAEARAVDQSFFEAQSRGLLSTEMTRAQRRARNAGSRDPSAIFAYGAKLPPGGGGSRWARIVSGSYDETVIIWKKGADGAWERSKILYQNEAVRAAGGLQPAVVRPRRTPPAGHNHGPGNAGNQNQNQNQNQTQQGANAPNFQALAQQAQAQAQAAQTLAQQAQALHTASQVQATHPEPANNGGAAAAAAAAATAPTATPATGTQGAAHTAGQGQAQQPATANGPAHHHHHHHHHGGAGGNAANAPGTSRVFKLQFDARRIVCCSQDPTIVGWDFANGDKEIMLASQFFGDSV